MSDTFVLRWNESAKADVGSIGQLDELLDRADAEARRGDPFLAELTAPSGAALSIGLGSDVSVVSYTGVTPPYALSLGGQGEEEGIVGADVVVFLYAGEETEFLRRNLITNGSARAAMREFFTTQQRPSAVRWEEL